MKGREGDPLKLEQLAKLLSLTHPLTHSLTLSLTHSHTNSRTVSLSLSLPLLQVWEGDPVRLAGNAHLRPYSSLLTALIKFGHSPN